MNLLVSLLKLIKCELPSDFTLYLAGKVPKNILREMIKKYIEY